MTSINTFQDILDALEQDPALREQLRRHILTDELLQLSAAVHELRADVAELKNDVAEIKTSVAGLQEGQARLETDVARMNGDLRRLTGKDYEGYVIRFADRLINRTTDLERPSMVGSDRNRAPGRANTGDKLLTLVASALTGGDCIDDADALRAGGTAGVLGCVVKAPSTLGTFLRSFRWGHVRQLDRVSRQLLARAWQAGAGPGSDNTRGDSDSVTRPARIYGYPHPHSNLRPDCRTGARPLLRRLPQPLFRLQLRPLPQLRRRHPLPRRRQFPRPGTRMKVESAVAIRTRSMFQGIGDRPVVPL